MTIGVGTGQMYQDEFGRAVSRTPDSHPDGYDGFVLWYRPRSAVREISENKIQVSNIQLRASDFDRFHKLSCIHLGGDYEWDTLNPYALETFLREWYRDPALVLVRIMQFWDPDASRAFWRVDCK